ncbi:PREDICTED: src kinase-associated phosphoprotein 2 [Propithecus coquereli]|uniref:src kinase-associated phosphoprotein 2 n=1 Tax=Propithecus coquereli TaxID=379532 RepID=UPI00063FB2A0|nr:PREDICTED: src kinase-associated phosphoprotein 2 [Propithecus coquereli]
MAVGKAPLVTEGTEAARSTVGRSYSLTTCFQNDLPLSKGGRKLTDGKPYIEPNDVWHLVFLKLITHCFFFSPPFPTGAQFPPIPAQDLPFVLKAGYLEKRRKDHSFLGFEWQKRWCALSKTVFYYYGSDKDKQQKGEFAIDGYNVRMNNTLRKDGKKDCCFEISAPDKRVYQFTAASPKDAEEWVQQLKFVLQDMESDVIPEDDDDRGELYDDVDHPLSMSSPSISSQPIDDEIYEELPEEEEDGALVKMEEQRKMSQDSVHHTLGDKSTDYANFYQGLWDCTGHLSDELSFKRGDVIYILSKEYNRYGWWVGEMKGAIGLVPKAYIMEMYDI